MPGVEILNETIIYTGVFNYYMVIILPILTIIISFILVLKDETIGDDIGIALIVALLIGLVSGILLGVPLGFACPIDSDEIDYIEYKVTISDEVSMNEFLDYYEILDQEGKIYTVKERD